MPYKPGKKKIDPTKGHGFIGQTPSKKTTPKPWVQPQWISEYIKARDRVIYSDMFTCEETKDAILLKYKT